MESTNESSAADTPSTKGIAKDVEEREEQTLDLPSSSSSSSAIATSNPFDATASTISMSAGADPWAEPSAFAPHINEMRRPGRDNPWATNSPVPELNEENGDEVTGKLTHEQSQSDGKSASASVASRENGTATTMTTTTTTSTTSSHLPPQDKPKYTLVKDEREGEYDLPRLGKAALRYWAFKPGYLNMNNGGYGACPKPVLDAVKQLLDQQEETPEHFRYNLMAPLAADICARLAKEIHCSSDELVLIPNSTTGTNSVLRDLVFKTNDAILTLNCTYGAVVENIKYLIDTEKMRGVELHQLDVAMQFPMSKQAILQRYTAAIDEAQKAGKRIRVAIVDPIASRPGIRLPWEEMVSLLRDRRILSLVDGAHAIGQIPLDLNAVQPDFFVSNCHKWQYAHRGCAVLYVPKRNRHIQRSSMPTSFYYTRDPTTENNTWQQQWLSPGTQDMSNFLSVASALDFRQLLGGEARIMNYTHDLAVRGGEAAARILGTEVMDLEDHSHTAAMTNVRLPIVRAQLASGKSTTEALNAWSQKADTWFFDRLFNEFKTFIPVYLHDGKVWARMSAQVWLEVDDFEFAARALLELCKRINAGQVSELQV